MRSPLIIVPLILSVWLSLWLTTGDPPGPGSRSGPDATFRRGLITLYHHEFEPAESLFRELATQHPDSADVWIALAISQLNQADPESIERASQSLAQAATLAERDPRIPYCQGQIAKYVGQIPEALAAFERARELKPNSADIHYQLGQCLVQLRRSEEAISHLEIAVEINENLEGAWYQLGLQYGRAGRRQDSQRALNQFKALQSSGRGDTRDLVFTEMGELAEPKLSFYFEKSPALEQPAFVEPTFASPRVIDGARAPFALVDQDFGHPPELWTEWGSFLLDDGRFLRDRGLSELENAYSFAVGDFTEDGRLDLVVGYGQGVKSYRGTEAGWEHEESWDDFYRAQVLLADLDLEGDLDLLVTAEDQSPQLGINRRRELGSQRTFGDLVQDALPYLAEGTRARVLADFDRDGDLEILFSGETQTALVDNGPEWRFEIDEERSPVEFFTPGCSAGDVDGDGDEDLLVAGQSSPGLWINDGRGNFEETPEHSSWFANCAAAEFIDLNLDGWLDIVIASPLGSRVVLGEGDGRLRLTGDRLPEAIGLASGDIDGDRDLDLFLRTVEGTVLFTENLTIDRTPRAQRPSSYTLYLGGVREPGDRRTNVLGIGARTLTLAGPKLIARTHLSPLSSSPRGGSAQGFQPITIGLGALRRSDATFVYWPDGVVQAEPGFNSQAKARISEVQRKSSSCPVLFAWNGEEYTFITDFMGGGGLGFWLDFGTFGPPDPSEVVRIPRESLESFEGEYRLSLMEPMQEVAYIDELKLWRVDHDEEVEIYPDEFFAASEIAPTGAPLAVRTEEKRYPSRVLLAGDPVRADKLSRCDRIYVEPKRLDPLLVGYCEEAGLVLEFSSPLQADDPRLFLNGWVEYPYSRVNFAAHQKQLGLEPPSFYWRDGPDAAWQLLYRHLGYPAGMPKTMVAKIPASVAARLFQIKIVTNMEIFWDEVFLAPARTVAAASVVPCPLVRAQLGFGGYPREYARDGRLPLLYYYDERQGDLAYEQLAGRATRYGPVEPLLDDRDDQFVIVAGGDELWLRFRAPAPAPGTATFLLETWGYCKDKDPLTAARDSIEPLPYRAMENYPPAHENISPDFLEYQRIWNTRRRGR